MSLPEDQCNAMGAACATVQRAHRQEAELTRIEKNILARAQARYVSYVADDAEYLGDLQKSFASSAVAWRTYRDAYCQAEPLVQGMSRDEQEALASDCRLRLTHSRIEQLKQLGEAIP
ncbi:lysozyme inhibitor LprI family protein [Xanthomonas medicagonis]|uniref:lysozyme inhibitor LprI family protein n=1 Tax=Xanthomonas medicagonis TaxID=3160841 RepID=UPI00351588F9